MLSEDDRTHAFGTSHRWANKANGDAVGPQGAALILELQRLRRAFEHGEAPPRRDPHRGKNSNPRKRQPKGKMGRVIEVCLEQVGLAPPASVMHGSDHDQKPATARSSQRQEPMIAHDNSSRIHLEQPDRRLNGKYQSMHIESPPMAPPSAAAGMTSPR